MSATPRAHSRILVIAAGHPERDGDDAARAAHALFAALRAEPDCTAMFIGGVTLRQGAGHGRAPLRAHAGRDDEYLLGVPALDRLRLASMVPHPGYWSATARALAALRPDIVLLWGLHELGGDVLRILRTACPAARIVVTIDDAAQPGPDRATDPTSAHTLPAWRALPERHALPAWRALRARWIASQLSCADAIVASTDAIRDGLVETGIAAARITVIPPGPPGDATRLPAYRALWASTPAVMKQAEITSEPPRRPRARAKSA